MFTREGFNMTARAQALNMIELIPDTDMPIVIEVLKRFISYDNDDIATEDDILAIQKAEREFDEGKTVNLNDLIL